ncbi:pentapeptide repeat-containing protein [Micromonospora sp. NPDC047557]|uniref:pentapeptide repeat-containing protein n=1 Tax=Micromonospora sp. NPDC047557 TaxID=3364250 RepID=UPI003711C20B
MELPPAKGPARFGRRAAASPDLPADDQVPALQLWHIGWSLALAFAGALAVVGVLYIAALSWADWPRIQRDGSVKATTLFELVKLVLAVVAGIGGVAALVVAYRRQRVAEHQNALAHADGRRAEEAKALAQAADKRAKIETDRNGIRLFNERFTKASEQLGSEKAAVRLAGVYAMAGLADDWREGRQTCIDVLCAYLRMPYAPPPDALNEMPSQVNEPSPAADVDTARTAREEREVRHTVIRLVGRHLRLADDNATSWRGCDFDFTGAVFDGADLADVTFNGGRVSFAGAQFIAGRSYFSGAVFSGGQVSFVRAVFAGEEVSFDGAVFSGGRVSFARAVFRGVRVSFDGAEFTSGRVHFLNVAFRDGVTSFDGAVFGRTVLFGEAVFSGGRANFAGADFQVPPRFDNWPGGRPPDGLILPRS